MGDLSKDFSRSEFACKCGCGLDTVDVELVDALQQVRDYYQRKVTLNSGCRCRAHNVAVGGSERSQHVYCRAGDFEVEDVRPAEVQAYLQLKYPDRFGIGCYETFTHLDTRTNGPARWSG